MRQKKVLIFGLGRQGRKYHSYFQSQEYYIVGVSKGGKTNLSFDEVYNFDTVISKPENFFHRFDFIIVSVFPISEQETVIRLLLEKKVISLCIIEKPICYDSSLLQKLLGKENFSFFVDEIILSDLYKKIFPDMKDLSFVISGDLEEDEKPHILEHAFGGFLGHEDFFPEQIPLISSDICRKDITHFSIYNSKYNLVIQSSDIYLNKKKIGTLDFPRKMKYIEGRGMNSRKNTLLKENFYKLNLFLHH